MGTAIINALHTYLFPAFSSLAFSVLPEVEGRGAEEKEREGKGRGRPAVG